MNNNQKTIQSQTYLDKVLRHLLAMPPGSRFCVADIAKDPAAFIAAVKQLHDSNAVIHFEIDLNQDETVVRRGWLLYEEAKKYFPPSPPLIYE
jgi:hypothetical protein